VRFCAVRHHFLFIFIATAATATSLSCDSCDDIIFLLQFHQLEQQGSSRDSIPCFMTVWFVLVSLEEEFFISPESSPSFALIGDRNSNLLRKIIMTTADRNGCWRSGSSQAFLILKGVATKKQNNF
jgi:hypothetical protein